MEFDESYFKAGKVSGVYYEEKDGFYVEEMMKRAWAAQIEVLKEIEAVCKRHGLTYYAEWGTMLGAVRHKGFIPWDDDIDISMKREDYEEFLKCAQKELPEGYSLLNIYTEEDYQEVFARVVNGRKIDFSEEHMKKFHGCPWAVGIDIFPMDYLSRNENEVWLQCEMIKLVSGAKQLVLEKSDESEQVLKEVEEVCGVKLDREKPMVRQLIMLLDRLSAMFREEESDELTMMHHYVFWNEGRRKKEWYDEVLWMPFENTEVPVPVGYHEALMQLYGAYLVPICKKAHDYPFYAKQEKLWREFVDRQVNG